MTIHIHAIWENNGSERAMKKARAFRNREAKNTTKKKLVAEITSFKTKKTPWWVNI